MTKELTDWLLLSDGLDSFVAFGGISSTFDEDVIALAVVLSGGMFPFASVSFSDAKSVKGEVQYASEAGHVELHLDQLCTN